MDEYSQMRRSVRIAAVLALAFFSAAPAAAVSSRADRAISYIRQRGDSSVEWRVIDPFAGSDTLFLVTAVEPTGIRWDSTLRTVEFVGADTVYHAPWVLGAQPEPVACLPSGKSICGFSFDSVGGAWEMHSYERPQFPEVPGDSLLIMKCVRESWTSRDGFAWTLTKRDSVICYEDESGCPSDEGASTTFASGRFLSSDELAPPLDITTSTQIGPDTTITLLVPLTGAPGRALLVDEEVRAPEEDCIGTPFYWTDTRTGSRRLVLGSEDPYDHNCANASEACGLVLLASWMHNRLIDASTGLEVLPLPPSDSPMFWTPRLGR